MKFKLKIVFFFICTFICLLCNKKNIKDNTQIKTLISNSENNNFSNLQKEIYLNTASGILEKSDNDSITRNSLFTVADIYYNLSSKDKYKKISKKVLELSIQSEDTAHIAKSLRYMADYYETRSIQDSALIYFLKSEKIYKSIDDKINIAKLKLYKAVLLYNVGNFDLAEIEAINSLKLLYKTDNYQLIYECNVLIGACETDLLNYKVAVQYYNIALNNVQKLEKITLSKSDIIYDRAACYNNIGKIYFKQNNYSTAIKFYSEGFKVKKELPEKDFLYAFLLNNNARAKIEMRNFDGTLSDLKQSLYISDSINDLSGIACCKISLGRYYLLQKDTTTALNYFKDGLTLSKEVKSNDDVLQTLKLLAQNDIKNQKKYTDIYFKVSDSIRNESQKTRSKFARIAFETDQIEEKNQILNQQLFYTILTSSGILSLVLGVFYVFRLRMKNKELKATEKQQKSNEKIYELILNQQFTSEESRKEERNRIAMELHDGVVNNLFTTRFNLELLASDNIKERNDLVLKLQNTENEIRRISHDLNKNLDFKDNHLSEIITKLIDDNAVVTKTIFDLTIDKYIDWEEVSGEIKINIYRIIQETIHNVNKYAKAEKCFIMLLKTNENITVRIWDDGIGFNQEIVKKGIGLKNINKRAKTMNAQLKIESEIGKGTHIELVI